ncbi:MAG: FkbM family methyltransferase [Candidatus Taylorbacteria bacterium]
MKTKLQFVIQKIRGQKHPIRFILSRVLWHSGLCSLFTTTLPVGIKIRFYPTSASASFWADSSYSTNDANFINDLLTDGDTFIDVGANIGHLTLIGGKKVGYGNVIAIEPNPRIFSFLDKNIKLNDFNNIKTYNIALGETDAIANFLDNKSDEQNFLTKTGSIQVSVKCLDKIFQGDTVALLKIDTEGYELPVLKGALNTISKTEVILFESCQRHFDRYGYSTRDIIDFLTKNNFRVFQFLSERELQEVDHAHTSETCENLVAVQDVNIFKIRLNKEPRSYLVNMNP